jgi:hypothetical protein
MTSNVPQPYVMSRELPPYRAILAVDAEGYTRTPGLTHQALSRIITEIAGDAFAASGLGPAWQNHEFFGHTGDGFAVGLPTRILPYLVYPFFHHLQGRLEHHNRTAVAGVPQIRLRASLNVGPLPTDHPEMQYNGNGPERNNTHRLLDSVPVRAMLSGSSPNVTFVVAILSDRVYSDVVEPGYTGIHPDSLIEANATVEHKQFGARGWLLVPKPSGTLADIGIPQPAAPAQPADATTTAASSLPAGGMQQHLGVNSGQNAQIVNGGMSMHGLTQR